MSECGYPSVYVVDTHATRPPVPPRLNRGRRSAGAAQTLLILLVCVALCGMAIEALFIYRLYKSESATSASASKIIADEVTPAPSLVLSPSKPLAHLTDGQDVVHGQHVMEWSMVADPLLYDMGYKNGSLVIQKEGYYHVYSKVSFSDIDGFRHAIHRKTKRYFGKSIPLLMSKFSETSGQMRSNSYLGGVFYLRKDDALFVDVSNTANILQRKPFENIFGAYMI